MTGLPGKNFLTALDHGRAATGERAEHGGVVREFSEDRSSCQIRFSRLSADDADAVIEAEKALADKGGYELEWKLYTHDAPSDLASRLEAAGFVADDREQVLALPLDAETMAVFDTSAFDVRRVVDEEGLADYAEIAREIGRKNADSERRRLWACLQETPDVMSVHVAYVGSEPVAGGRVHYPEGAGYAELAGGRTKTTHRLRGMFTAVVGSRLVEVSARGLDLVFTDALPTSEPILAKRGFRTVVGTQPFVYTPSS
ncbi:hypothetical protein [Streptomyces sp. NBC_00140]|uniref:hypothetical protein n=1 Tax=Streptomyces sp. NBC_00140 TaxID=2975664 RepID=UPI00224F77A4|nr:hypothetical protein [Streptomyces sp. NBC_00140]MCX5328243.1 hypothetical protein [Streptomyces sp. NBC_00140]